MTMKPTDCGIGKALVLAAGKSTRIRAAAGDIPKPLIEVAGQTVLERNLRTLAGVGVREAWVNLHYEGRQIEDRIGDGRRLGLDVRYSREPEILGTAGAAKKLERELRHGTFFVVYGDNLVSLDWTRLAEAHARSDALVTIAVFDFDRVPNTGLAGGRVVLDEANRVERFVEGGGNVSPYVNAGVYLVEPAVLSMLPDGFSDFGKDVFPKLISDGGRLMAFPIDGYCLAIDTPEALAKAEEMMRGFASAAEVATR